MLIRQVSTSFLFFAWKIKIIIGLLLIRVLLLKIVKVGPNRISTNPAGHNLLYVMAVRQCFHSRFLIIFFVDITTDALDNTEVNSENNVHSSDCAEEIGKGTEILEQNFMLCNMP